MGPALTGEAQQRAGLGDRTIRGWIIAFLILVAFLGVTGFFAMLLGE